MNRYPPHIRKKAATTAPAPRPMFSRLVNNELIASISLHSPWGGWADWPPWPRRAAGAVGRHGPAPSGGARRALRRDRVRRHRAGADRPGQEAAEGEEPAVDGGRLEPAATARPQLVLGE